MLHAFTVVKLDTLLLQASSFLSVSHLIIMTRIKLDDTYKTFAQFLPWNKQLEIIVFISDESIHNFILL